MSLPKRPERSVPIPNDPFDSPEVTAIKGPYWDMALGEGLELNPDGNIIAPDGTGETVSDQATINSSYFASGIGKGLGVVDGNEFSRVDLPPYNCRTTDLYTASVTNFSSAWYGCTSLTSFPLLDVSQGTYFNSAWYNCTSLTSFPQLDVSQGINFGGAWFNCNSLTSFPLLDVSQGIYFNGAWYNCNSLTSFPLLDVSQGTYFNSAWQNCTSLTTFPASFFNNCSATNFSQAWRNCALNQTSVNNILISLNTAGQLNGTVNLNGGTSAAPSGAGLSAKASLQGKGWTVITN